MIHSNIKVFLPVNEYRLLSQQYALATEIFRLFTYYRKFQEKCNYPSTWLGDTRNAYFDQQIRNWCMLFGSKKEPTHYKHLLKTTEFLNEKLKNMGIIDENALHQKILDFSGTTDQDFEDYHKKTKNYRDRYLIHREHDSEKITEGNYCHPYLDKLFKTTCALFCILHELFLSYPTEKVDDYEEMIYDKIQPCTVETIIEANKWEDKPLDNFLNIMEKM